MKRVKRLDTIIDETAAAGTTVQRKGKTRRKEMAVLYTIRFGGGEPMPISCVADAVKALADPRWQGRRRAQGGCTHIQRRTGRTLQSHSRA